MLLLLFVIGGGLVLLGYGLGLEKATSIRQLQRELLIYFAGSLFIVIALSVSLHFLITRRLERLKSAMTDFAEGKPLATPPAGLGDEISDLGTRFNEMAATAGKEMNERRRMQDALRESVEEIQDLYNHAPCGYDSLDASGTFVRINDTELSWLGYTREEILGKVKLTALLTPQSRLVFQREFPKFKECGSLNDVDLEIVRKDGTILSVVLSATAIKDERGHFVMSRSVMHDITERKRTEEKLRNSEARYRALHRDNPLMIFTLDTAGTMLSVNPTGAKQLGYTNDELVGKSVLQVFHPDDRTQVRRSFEECLRHPEHPHRWQFRKIRKDGELLWVEELAQVVTDLGGTTNVLIVCQDITARKRAEDGIQQLNQELEQRVADRTAELEFANKELESFAFSVSHDLRSPLRSIDGFSRALEEDYTDKLDDEGKEYLRTIRAASQRMSMLIDDILTLSRLSRAPLQLLPVDLSALAAAVAGDLRKDEPDRHVEIIIEPGCVAYADENLMRIVLDNLIGNAWKFTGKQSAARIEFGLTTREGVPAYFVRDNGAGFDMAYASKLFSVFQRLHTMEEFPGTGIGLTNVQRIIRRHGGKIWLEGRLNEGATAYFTLPPTGIPS